MNCGIIGLPNVGKTALFNLLTGNNAASSNYPYCTVDPNIGVAVLEDERMDRLSGLFPSAKITYPHVQFTDVAGLPPGASSGEGLGNQFLSTIRNVDSILHVVRAFKDQDVSRFDSGNSDPQKDLELVQTELFLSDIEIAKRRSKDNPLSEYWKKTVQQLENEIVPERDEDGVLLTPKPQITVINTSTGSEKPQIGRDDVLYIDVAFQQELLQMDAGEREMFLSDMPEWECTAGNVIERVKELLGQITFFTVVGGREIKGYNIKSGMSVYEASGRIHTDIMKGFIRAKVFNYNELAESGFDIESIKKSGKLRIEGKDYIVKEGDIVEVLFN